MRILITNIMVGVRSGTEVFVEQLADWLRRHGHTPVLYTPLIGPLGEEMRNRGHRVHDRIDQVQEAPDVIHGHHCGPTMTALAAFPAVPALFVSHSVAAEFDRPPVHPNIRRYLAVSSLVRERWASPDVPMDRIGILHNAVDTERFPRRGPLPDRPRRAVLVAKMPGHVEAVRQACADHDLVLEEVGNAVGKVVPNLPGLFQEADIVFASGRSAFEAAASGCAVVLADGQGMHGLMRAAEIGRLADLNCGVGSLVHPPTAQALSDAVAAYDAADAAAVSGHVRDTQSLDAQGRRLLRIYAELRESPIDGHRDGNMAVARFLERYVPHFGWDRWRALARNFGEDALPPVMAALAQRQRVEREDRIPAPAPAPAPAPPAPSDRPELLARLEELGAELAAIRNSTSWKLTAPLRKVAGRFRGL